MPRLDTRKRIRVSLYGCRYQHKNHHLVILGSEFVPEKHASFSIYFVERHFGDWLSSCNGDRFFREFARELRGDLDLHAARVCNAVGNVFAAFFFWEM